MAAHHVHPPPPNLNLNLNLDPNQPSIPQTAQAYGDGGGGGVNYNSLYAQGQVYPNNLLPPQRNGQTSASQSPAAYNASAFSPPAWQSTATTPASTSAAAQYLNANLKSHYNSSQSNQFSAYVAAREQQFGQNGNTLAPGTVHGRSYGTTAGASSASQSTPPIAPAAKYQSGPTGQFTNASAAEIRNAYPTQPMGIQPHDQHRPAVADGAVPPSQPRPAPKGVQSGNFVIVNFDDLAKSTQSKRLHNFVNISQKPVDLNLTRVNIPQYIPRKSQNELRKLASTDAVLRAKILKRGKKAKTLVSRVSRPFQASEKGSPVSLSSASESSDSDSDSEYESGSPAPEKSPLPASRPQKMIEAIKYDTIKAVWLPRNKFAENQKIIEGLAALWEVVKTVRDRWKKDKEAVKSALETKQTSELPLLRERVEKQVEMMEALLNAAVEFGHPDLLSVCGQNGPLMSTCYMFMLEPVREGNYTNSFIKIIFKFLSKCTNLNSELAEKCNLSKLFTRSAKRGSEEIKALTAKINSNILASDKKGKIPGAKPSDSKTTEKKISKGQPDGEATSGIKRPRPADGVAGQPAKRLASGMNAANSNQVGASKLAPVKKAAATTTTATSTLNKPKPAVKPTTSFFSGLQSASKRPRTEAAVSTVKKPTPAAPVMTAKPAFSFAETMANLNKEQKQEPVKKLKKDENENRGPETEEEKAKRLRKEARRSLRVKWNDAALEHIKYFSRDPSELPSRTSNRDVKTGNEKEGLMFKQHVDMMDVDIDDEDDQPTEQTFFDYRDPIDVDFTTLPLDERSRNYDKFGGVLKADSPEQLVQENRAANTLMEHYLSRAEIPPNPREPADPYAGSAMEFKSFGYPDSTSAWLLSRLSRFPAPASSAPPTQSDISSLLQAIGGILPQPAPQPQPAPVPDLSALQGILSKANSIAPQPPPLQQPGFAWPQVPQPAAPADAGAPKSLEAILAELGGNAQSAPAPAPQAPMPFAPPPPPPPPAVQPSSDVSAMIAQLMQNAQAGNASAGGYVGYGTTGQTPALNGYQADDGSGGDGGDRKPDPLGKKFLFPCRYFKEGKCKKADQCTFRHDM